MSYELAFWSGGDELDPLEVYRSLDAEPMEPVPGLRAIDPAEVDRAIVEVLKGWTRDGIHLHPPGVEIGSAPVFEMHIGRHIARFFGYGIEEGDHFNAIIDVMRPLGYRLFDPQTNERFG